MERREHATRVRFEAVRSRRDEYLEDGASLTIRRRASRLTIESEESTEHFGTARSPSAPKSLPPPSSCL